MSTLPTRRTTRTTRATAGTVKDLENAHARPARSTTTSRAKPPSSSTVPIKEPSNARATAATAASRAKSAAALRKENGTGVEVKRKREALAEVSIPLKARSTAASSTLAQNADVGAEKLKGKQLDSDGGDTVVVKKTTTTTTKVTTSRQALRTISGPAQPAPALRQTRSSTIVTEPKEQRQVLAEVKEEEVHVHVEEEELKPSDGQMQISPPAAERNPRQSIRNSTVTTASVFAPRQVPQRRVYEGEEEQQDRRVFKKRRTSSEADHDHQLDDKENALVEEQLVAAEAEPEAKQEYAEADPAGEEWDDLDAEDEDDPQMVSEYVKEIFEYLLEVEQTTMPNPNYLERQQELKPEMRGILTDWLIQVHYRFRLLPETLFLAVNIIDRFLSTRMVSVLKLQLVGIAALFVASKVEEIVAPSASNFVHIADGGYTEAEILQAEKYILRTLDWNLSYPNPMHFLRRISKADNYDVHSRTLAKYFLEISVVERRLLAAPPSLLAAAAVWLGRLVLTQGEWTPNLAHYSSYPESALIPTAAIMLRYCRRQNNHENLEKKYASRKFYKASRYVRQWAMENFNPHLPIDLVGELPKLREMGRVRAAEQAKLELEQAELGIEQDLDETGLDSYAA